MTEFTADHMTTPQLITYLRQHAQGKRTQAVIDTLQRRMMTRLPEEAERAYAENLVRRTCAECEK